MCIHSDLFGDVIVTLDDVEFWLDNVPKHLSNSPNARIRYARDYDVASKIKYAKRTGSYYKMLADKENLSRGDTSTVKALYHPDYEGVLLGEKKVHRLAHLLGKVS